MIRDQRSGAPRGPSPAPRLTARLASDEPLLAVELRPPRRDLEGVHAMDAWIDVYQAVHRLAPVDTLVFLTDNAVGTGEEENLGHLVRNIGSDAPRGRVMPFLTLKHTLGYCRSFAARARAEGFPGLVVLGGDRHDGIERCLPHAWELRERLRAEQPGLLLGGWVNPHRDADEQAEFMLRQREGLDFALTQIVSHHDTAPVERYLEAAARRGVDDLPLFAGVFFYRSARAKTLDRLAPFIPVPRAGLEADFKERGMSAVDVAATTLARLSALGLRRFYLSNLETARAARRLSAIARAAGLSDPVAPAPGALARRDARGA